MKTFLFALLTMVASPAEVSERELQDASGRPVPGARLFLGEVEVAGTGPDGKFRLSGAPAPPFELTVFDARARGSGASSSPTAAIRFCGSGRRRKSGSPCGARFRSRPRPLPRPRSA
jgi:hypothetical protein